MDWGAIGAVGEILAAGGVIVTLVYLSLQVRSSAKATESQMHASLSAEMEHLTTALSQYEALVDALVLAQSNGDITESQRARLLWWFSGFFRVCESHFIQSQLGATQIELKEPIANLLRLMIRQTPLFDQIAREGVKENLATKDFLQLLDKEVLIETPPAG
jgi:hypothetical protein